MKKTLAYGVASSQGSWPVQEDGFLADPVSGFFALADGFGGRGAGDLAAKAVLAEVRAKREAGSGPELTPDLRRQREAFAKAHQLIRDRNEKRAAASRGGSSAITARIDASGLVSLTQCGACSALLVKGGKIHPVLLPQAPFREEFQPLLPNQALGVGTSVSAESRVLDLEAGDILALLTSGLEWESDSFQLELTSQLAVRGRGEDLSAAASHIVQNCSLSAQNWNRTIVLIERL
jgi:serine/threonine protein phosphatase PrpC